MDLSFFKEASQRAAQAQERAAQNKKKKEDEERKKREAQAKARKEEKKRKQAEFDNHIKSLSQKNTNNNTYKFDGNFKKYNGKTNTGGITLETPSRAASLSKPTADTYKFDGNFKKYDGKADTALFKLSAPVTKQAKVKSSTAKDFATGVGQQLWGGYGKWAEGINKAAYHGVKYIPGVGSTFKKAIDNQEAYNKANLESGSAKIQKHLGNGFASSAVNSLSQSAGQMIPDVITTFMTAGANRGASLAKLTADSGVSKWVQALKLPKESTPLFLSNLGNAYDEAIKNGANDGQALTSALINAYPQTVIEHSGGIQDLIKDKSKEHVLKSIITSAIDEGKEEFLQYPFEELSKLPYAPVTPYSDNPEVQAVINPKAQAQAAAVGALGGLVFGGVNTAFEGAANVAGKTVTGAKLKDFKQDIIDKGLNSPDGTYANDNALKLDNKKHVSLYDIGKQYELNVQQQESYKDGKYHTIPYEQPRKTIVPPSTEAEYKTQEKTVKKPVSTEFEDNYKKKPMQQTEDAQAPSHDAQNASVDNGFYGDSLSQSAADVNRAFTEFEALERAKYNEAAKIKAVTPIYMQAKTLNSSQKRLVEDCRTLGIPVTFIEGTRVQTRGSSLNGAYYNGNVFINTAADNPYNVVVAHEVLHRIKDSDTDAYEQLCSVVNDALGENNDFSRLDGYEQEEALADVMGDIISDPKKYREIFRQKQNLLQRILGYIRDMISRLTGKNNGNFKNASEFTESLRDAEGKLTEIYKKAVGMTGEYGNNTRYSAEQGIYDYTKPFAQQIEDYKNGKIPQNDSLLVGGTPEVFKQIGFNSLPVTINQKHVDYAVNGTKDIDHHIGETMLSQLPEAIKDPVAVFRSNTNSNRLVALLEFTINGKNVVAPFEIDGYGRQNSIRIDSNAITSIYGKNNAVSSLLKNAIDDEINGKTSLFYINNKKTAVLLQRAGLQLPGGLFQNNGYVHSIREKGANVNTRFENVTETQQFRRWFGDWINNPKKASKVVNDDGTPKVVYHGTKNFGFTVFDTIKSDDKSTLFFTDSAGIASTYSGKEGVSKLQNGKKTDLSGKSPKEIAEALNTAKIADDEYMELKYSYLDKNKISGIESGVRKNAEDLLQYLYKHDFSGEKDNVKKQAENLIAKLEDLEHESISTPLYMLLHHSSVFGNGDNSAKFANLEKNVRLINEIKKSGKSDVIIGESLDGYSFDVYDTETAKELLSQKLNRGNYAVYLDIKNPYIVEADGHNWNDITYRESLSENGNGIPKRGTTREAAAYAKSQGFDGVIFKNISDNGANNSNIDNELSNVYVVFNSNQIKSATDNIGTYDKSTPDIRYSKTENTADNAENFKFNLRHVGLLVNANEAMLTKQNFKLSEVLSETAAPYETHPFLKDTKVVFDETAANGRYYDAGTNTIHLDKNSGGYEVNAERILRCVEDAVNSGKHAEDGGEYVDTSVSQDIDEIKIEPLARNSEKESVHSVNASSSIDNSVPQNNVNVNDKHSQSFDTPETIKDVYKYVYKNKYKISNIRKLESKLHLEDWEINYLDKLCSYEIDWDDVPDFCNIERIRDAYKIIAPLKQAVKRIENYNKYQAQQRLEQAQRATKNINEWKQKSGNIIMTLRTMDKNFESIIKDYPGAKEDLEYINKTYLQPVSKSEAERTRYINNYRERIKALNLTKAEAVAVQLYGEGKDISALYAKDYLTEAEKAFVKKIKGINDVNNKNAKKEKEAFLKKVSEGVKEFREIYDDIYEDINNSLIENGYPPIAKLEQYFPHFHYDVNTLFNRFKKSVNLNPDIKELPSNITGTTHFFKPGRTYFQHGITRKGEITWYDAVDGFDRYIETSSDLIFHTGDIRRIRALEQAIRFESSDEQTKREVRAIQKDPTKTTEQKGVDIEEILAKNEKRRNGGFNAIINTLKEYGDVIANKKLLVDRPYDQAFGRATSQIFNAGLSNTGGNMVALNLSSASTNIVPVVKASFEIPKKYILRGAVDTLFNKLPNRRDDFILRSDFLTNRNGTEKLIMLPHQKFQNFADIMQAVDMFSSETVVRARYYENFHKLKMSETEALNEADEYAKNVFAGRAKGEMPLIFYSKNPIVKVFTQFQLETANDVQELLYYAPKRSYERYGAKGLVKYITNYLVGAYLFNEIYEYLFGRRVMLDPVALIEEGFEDITGYRIPNKIDLLLKKDKIEKYGKEKSITEKILSIGNSVLEEVPFVGGFLGGGRLPAAVSLPNIQKTFPAVEEVFKGEKSLKENAGKIVQNSLLPLGYLVNPLGGLNQIQKAVKGINAVNKGTATNDSGKVQYAVDKTPGNYIKAALFGKSALPEARRYYDSNGKPFSDKETEEYNERVAAGEANLTVYADINERRKAKEAAANVNRFIKNSANPSNIGIYKELKRLKDEGVNTEFEAPDTEFKADGKTVKLNSFKYAEYAREASRTAEAETVNLFKSKHYPTVNQEECLKEVYSYAKALAKTKVSNYKLSSEYEKIKLASENGFSAGEFIAVKKAMGDGAKTVDNVYKFAKENGYSQQQSENLINLVTLSNKEYKRIANAGGFKSGYMMHTLYYKAKNAGIKTETCFVPIAREDFSYTNKKAGIKFSTTLNDKELDDLQKMYVRYYENGLKMLNSMKFKNIGELYETTRKIRSGAMNAAKRDYYAYLTAMRKGKN